MRKPKNDQLSIFCQWSEHRFSSELQEISKILDSCPEIIDLVTADLNQSNKKTGKGAHVGHLEFFWIGWPNDLRIDDCWMYHLSHFLTLLLQPQLKISCSNSALKTKRDKQ